MAYKDKDRQREADRLRQQRRRDAKKAKGVTIAGRDEGVTVIAKDLGVEAPANYGQPDCTCQHCQTNRANGNRHVLNHGSYKPAHQLGRNELNRVSLSGDPDYTGVCLDAKYDSRRSPQTQQEAAQGYN